MKLTTGKASSLTWPVTFTLSVRTVAMKTGCNYTRCHGDGFEVKGKCYILMRKQSTTTFEADEQCKDRGSRLARFDSVDEIRAVTKLLWKRQPFDFKVGLVEPFLDLPPM